MKKTWLLVFLGLTVAGLPLFAGGMADMFSGKRGGQQGSGISGAPAEAAAVAEMPPLDSYAPPSPRAGLQRAGSNVYVWAADPLNAVDEKLPPPVYAISGVRGREIGKYIVGGDYQEKDFLGEVVDVIVILPEKESFSRGILEGTDVSDWIQNLPRGLEARAHGIKKGATSIKLYISGTPEVTMREVIRVTIPGTWLTGGSARSFVSPTEEDSYNSWVASQTQE